MYNLPGVTLKYFDIWLFKQINLGLADPVLDKVMLVATAMGTGAAQTAICLVVALFGWVLDRVDLRKAGYAGLTACAAAGIAVQLAKAVFSRPRPLCVLFDARSVGAALFNGSFPSGHAMTAFAAAAAAGAFVPWFRYVLIPLAALVSLSRVYVGAHFPLDVAAGGVMGALIGAACARWIRCRTAPEASQGEPGP